MIYLFPDVFSSSLSITVNLFYNFILQEEQSKILATNSEILNLQLRSCKDSYFLNNKLLQKQIEEIGKFISWFLACFPPVRSLLVFRLSNM